MKEVSKIRRRHAPVVAIVHDSARSYYSYLLKVNQSHRAGRYMSE